MVIWSKTAAFQTVRNCREFEESRLAGLSGHSETVVTFLSLAPRKWLDSLISRTCITYVCTCPNIRKEVKQK